MKISIITVSYNSQSTILDTIDSVNHQDYPNIEHVFIDGKSTDNTLDIIKSKSKRKKRKKNKKKKGHWPRRWGNRGVRAQRTHSLSHSENPYRQAWFGE